MCTRRARERASFVPSHSYDSYECMISYTVVNLPGIVFIITLWSSRVGSTPEGGRMDGWVVDDRENRGDGEGEPRAATAERRRRVHRFDRRRARAGNWEEVASRVSKLGSKVWDWDWNSAPDDRRDRQTTPDATPRDSKWVRARRETTATTRTEV